MAQTEKIGFYPSEEQKKKCEKKTEVTKSGNDNEFTILHGLPVYRAQEIYLPAMRTA